jgi:hypothetical protein
MAVAYFLLFFLLVWGVWSISGHLARIAAHNARFLPPESEVPLAGSKINAGDIISVREDGVSRYVVVEGIADGPNCLIVGIAPSDSKPS